MSFKDIIDTETEQEENINEFKDIFSECLVDLDKPSKPLDTLVYIGEDERGKK